MLYFLKNSYLTRVLFVFVAIFFVSTISYAEVDMNSSMSGRKSSITTDSRVRTLVYNPNEVFRVKFHYDYQSYMEFNEVEEIELISIGNPYGWQIVPSGKRLFIKPLVENTKTNMTIITNLRTYNFEIVSSKETEDIDEEVVYVLRFFYPDQSLDNAPSFVGTSTIKPPVDYQNVFEQDGKKKDAPLTNSTVRSEEQSMVTPILPPQISQQAPQTMQNPVVANNNMMPPSMMNQPNMQQPVSMPMQMPPQFSSPPVNQQQSIVRPSIGDFPTPPPADGNEPNYNYTIAGQSMIIEPTKVYDDTKNTYFYFKQGVVPKIYTINYDGSETAINYSVEKDGALKVAKVAWQFSIRLGNELVCVFNENKIF